MKRPSILVAHPWMGRGGSEATAMWTVEALQDDYDLTFVTASRVDWAELNRVYGTAVDPLKFQTLKAPVLPGVNGPNRLVYLQQRYFGRYCRKIASSFDLCLSAYNPIDFGRPAIHLIGDFSFSEEMRRRLNSHATESFQHRSGLLRRLYLGLGDWIGGRRPPLSQWGGLILANSAWSARQLETHFGVFGAEVIFPPVTLPVSPAGSGHRDPMGFVCLGRVVPEKEIERIVRILRRVRDSGYPVSLHLIGDLQDSDYGRELARMIEPDRDWIIPTGFLALEAKWEILSSRTYAIHACRIEAFGIAVAEMASMGCLPFVPSTGGAGEIVPLPELQYGDDDEAVVKILTMLENPRRVKELAEELPCLMERFGPPNFKVQLSRHVIDFAERVRVSGK